MSQITKNCYFLSGLCAESPWAVNAGFVVGAHTTLIVDTGSNFYTAQTIFGYATCAKPDNRLIVVNTEPHFDHIGGNSYFRDREIDVFAHPELVRTEHDFEKNKADFNRTILNRARKDASESNAFYFQTKLANPNRSVTLGKVFDLGHVNVMVHATPGHTPLNISLFIPEDSVLYCGDTVVAEYIPNLECGDVSLWENWLTSIDLLEALRPEIIVPGHGDQIAGTRNIRRQFNEIRGVLREAIETQTAPTFAGE